jgi:hypothetical protein
MTINRALETGKSKARPFAFSMRSLPHRFRPRSGHHVPVRVHVATTGPEPGNWLIAIDANQCRVFDGSTPEPDARVYTDSTIGAAILSGDQSLAAAIASRLLDYDGDLEVLRSVAACLGLEEEQ